MKVLLQSLLLLLSFAIVFIWEQSPLSGLTLQIIGVLIAAYIAMAFIRVRKGKQIVLGGTLGIFILNSVILLFIFATGGFSSAFFFLIYFIIFALVFVFEPYTIIAFCMGVVLLLLPLALRDDIVGNFIKLGSIILISPLALFFGREYQKSSGDEAVAEKIEEDIGEVMEAEENKLSKVDLGKLEKAMEEARKLKENHEDIL